MILKNSFSVYGQSHVRMTKKWLKHCGKKKRKGFDWQQALLLLLFCQTFLAGKKTPNLILTDFRIGIQLPLSTTTHSDN